MNRTSTDDQKCRSIVQVDHKFRRRIGLQCFSISMLVMLLADVKPIIAQSAPDKYFLTNDGVRIEVCTLDSVNSHTLYFSTPEQVQFIPLDSISEYHYQRRSIRVLWGALIGGVTGTLLGVAIGSGGDSGESDHPGGTITYSNYYKSYGAALGYFIGSGIGTIAGLSGQNATVNFRYMATDDKVEQFDQEIAREKKMERKRLRRAKQR